MFLTAREAGWLVPSARVQQVGFGSVLGLDGKMFRYADLPNDRVKDYVFDWGRMLSFEGNTAPYLQHARARIRSIFRRAGRSPAGRPDGCGRLRTGGAGTRAVGVHRVS